MLRMPLRSFKLRCCRPGGVLAGRIDGGIWVGGGAVGCTGGVGVLGESGGKDGSVPYGLPVEEAPR